MKLYIKCMVSLRCKLMVEKELQQLEIQYAAVELGYVEMIYPISPAQRQQLKNNLAVSGLLLLDNKKIILVEKIKNAITELIHHSDELPLTNFSDYLSQKLQFDYTYLANTFSDVEHIPIQQFIIINKIERVKEFLLYNEHTLTEIAYQLHYSSVGHLSNQFKKVTGLSPSTYKSLQQKRTNNLENV